MKASFTIGALKRYIQNTGLSDDAEIHMMPFEDKFDIFPVYVAQGFPAGSDYWKGNSDKQVLLLSTKTIYQIKP